MYRGRIYLGEVVSLAGSILFAPSWAKAVLLAVVIALQALRAFYEERLLASAMPGYREYQRRSWRLVPGIF